MFSKAPPRWCIDTKSPESRASSLDHAARLRLAGVLKWLVLKMDNNPIVIPENIEV